MAAAYEGAIQTLIDAFAKLPGIGPKGAQRIAFYLLNVDENDVHELAQSIIDMRDKVRFCDVCSNVCEVSPCSICIDPRRDRTTVCVVQDPKDVMSIERTHEYRGVYHVLGGAINPMANIGPQDLNIAQLVRRIHASLAGKGEQSPLEEAHNANVSSSGVDESHSGSAQALHPFPLAPNYANGTMTSTQFINSMSDSTQVGSAASLVPSISRFETSEEIREIILALNPDIEGEATTTYLGRLLSPMGVTITRLASGLPVGGDLEYADEITLGRALARRYEV